MIRTRAPALPIHVDDVGVGTPGPGWGDNLRLVEAENPEYTRDPTAGVEGRSDTTQRRR